MVKSAREALAAAEAQLAAAEAAAQSGKHNQSGSKSRSLEKP